MVVRTEWTSEQPGGEGWYWYRDGRGDGAEVLEVGHGQYGLVVTRGAQTYALSKFGGESSEWCGPIPAPLPGGNAVAELARAARVLVGSLDGSHAQVMSAAALLKKVLEKFA